jgi:hypothetical protein
MLNALHRDPEPAAVAGYSFDGMFWHSVALATKYNNKQLRAQVKGHSLLYSRSLSFDLRSPSPPPYAVLPCSTQRPSCQPQLQLQRD